MTRRRHRLIELAWPDFGEPGRPAPAPAAELRRRLDAALAAMEERGLSHLVVYGDREHFANMAWLTGFDPRYEEALLVLSRARAPLAVVGNEGEAYLPISPLLGEGGLRKERFQPFSLLDQPRDDSRALQDILAGEGIGAGARVGCVGWKYFSERELPAGRHAVEIPAYVVDTLRALCGPEAVVNATDLFMSAEAGLRTSLSVWEIAQLEYANGLASEGVRRIVFNLREGLRDDELARFALYDGYPLAAHMTVRTGGPMISLSSPSGAVLKRGNRFSCSLCYRGANICRAGWVAERPEDLPSEAYGYVPEFAGPYFEVMAQWYAALAIGASGGALAEIVEQGLPRASFGVFLNPGHLIHLDEWVSSPFYAGSRIALRSGMAIQSDVIPSSKTFYSSRMEEGVVLADAALQAALGDAFPHCLARCRMRRRFMAEVLGLELREEALPLSNIAGLVPPYLLRPNRVLALEP